MTVSAQVMPLEQQYLLIDAEEWMQGLTHTVVRFAHPQREIISLAVLYQIVQEYL